MSAVCTSRAAPHKKPTGMVTTNLQVAYRISLAKRHAADVRHALAQVDAIVKESPYDRDDPLVANCLTEEWNEIKALANGVERLLVEMQKEVIEKDADAKNQLGTIGMLRQRALADVVRAERCVTP
jgi:hypothetical protein